jgi:putative ABC transport system substrate-binding protein
MASRRILLGAAAAAAIATPFSAFSQPQRKVPRVGFLYFASRQSAVDTGRYDAFMKGMRELGYISGTNLVLDERYADGKAELVPRLAAELLQANVDVIVATGTQTYRPLQQATTTVPVVVTVTADPVANGYAVSLARPGGNFTGFSDSGADILFKQIELLQLVAPKTSRLGVLVNPGNSAHPWQLMRVLSAAQKGGMQVVMAEATSPGEIERELSMLAAKHIDALMIFNDNLFVQLLNKISGEALKQRLPSIYGLEDYAAAGGLLSYGPNLVDNFRRAAVYVDRILRGAKAGDLPFEQPTRFYLTVNRATARTLGIKIPEELSMRADKVFQ